jgi:ketosteroid isomerase-like protein
MPSKKESVFAMENAAFSGDWDTFKTFLAEDVYFRVGNSSEVRGAQNVVDWMKNMMKTRLTISGAQTRNVWEQPDAVIVEFDVTALRVKDNKNVVFPCLDIYRFGGDKITDWRAFAIEPTHIAERSASAGV